jgi:hypothetical protein
MISYARDWCIFTSMRKDYLNQNSVFSTVIIFKQKENEKPIDHINFIIASTIWV